MSTGIKVQRICENCGNLFIAQTTVTRFCSHRCANSKLKQNKRIAKIEESNKQTIQIFTRSIEELKAREFLTVKEVARLLNCSIRSVYYYIGVGTIKSVNFGQRITRVKRSEIDKLFEQSQSVTIQTEFKQFEISDCYSINEVKSKFGISESALRNLVIRENVPKLKKGVFAYLPKSIIDKLLNKSFS